MAKEDGAEEEEPITRRRWSPDESSGELRLLDSEAHELEGQIERNLDALRDPAARDVDQAQAELLE